ncbi:lipopolysaccharide export system protein LptA [Malonomonas rubra DSM 5091]|uniref:Lipopolysaccharide export system protein LptA n=1 Tax=Malonomonas rubra DSM 5091 TaxID=1122189 RepID=A0A1M6DYA5_MALRU|nr:lipopolysaccharide transport periplasmic protein LptA [Malonomonas rubra]SHI78139.1 lipopolysaccharide export system protein LptA [Malonomonas rubra DSM 5091]
MNKLSLFICCSLLLWLSGFSFAAELPKPSSLPIEVTANQLEADQQKRQAIFTGDVVAKQGDVTLYGDKMVVYQLDGQEQVDRLEVFGHVRVVQLDRTATAERAVYRQVAETLTLYGNAEVHQGQNRVAGDEIIVYLRENRSLVKSGDSGRVKAILFPQQKQEQQ